LQQYVYIFRVTDSAIDYDSSVSVVEINGYVFEVNFFKERIKRSGQSVHK